MDSVVNEGNEDDAVMRAHGSVSDPVLMCEGAGCVDDELVILGVVYGCGLHLNGVVAVVKLCQRKAANFCKAVYAITVFLVPSLSTVLPNRLNWTMSSSDYKRIRNLPKCVILTELKFQTFALVII